MPSNSIEIWKDIPKYEGRYQVSNQGQVKSCQRIIKEYDSRWGQERTKRLKERIMKPAVLTDKYSTVGLSKNAIMTTHGVHRLVLLAFIGPCPKNMECCHRDGNKRNNKLSNLRWDTRKGNFRDNIANGTILRGEKNPMVKLKENDVREIRKLWKIGIHTQRELGDLFGVAQITISLIVTYKRWKHI